MLVSSRLLTSCLLFALLSCATLALAQDDPQPTPPANPSGTFDVEALYAASFDIPRLRALNELKLTEEQLDQTVIMVSETQKAYQKQLREMATRFFAKLEKTLRKTKKDGLEGKSTDYDEDTRKSLEEYPRKVTALDQEFIVLYTVKFKQILTKSQITAAAKFARIEQRKLSPDAKGSDEQWFNFYVNGIFQYPRLLQLLQEMQVTRKAPKEKADIPPPPQ